MSSVKLLNMFKIVILVYCFVWTVLGDFNNPPIAMKGHSFAISESTPIGSTIFQLNATDPDGDSVSFGTLDQLTAAMVKVLPAVWTGSLWSSSITLNQYLDRDDGRSSIHLQFYVADGTNKIPLLITMHITDANDNPPTLTGLPYQLSLRENQSLGTMLYLFRSVDPDENEGGTPLYSMKVDEMEYNSTFNLDASTGIVTLTRPLDFERRVFYHFKVSAKDEGSPPCPGPQCLCRSDEWTGANKDYCNGSVVDFFITINDVEDTPPIFERVPYVGSVLENKTINHTIMRVKATDGDRGVAIPIEIKYSLSDSTVPFWINDNGDIMVSKTLDADDEVLRERGGLYVFNVTATEVGSPPPNEASTLVSITVQDVNDNKPEFNSHNFNASVLENTPQGVPLTMTSNIEVTDKDQGTNSCFRIFVQTMDGFPEMSFSTIPGQDQTLQGSSTVTIVVNDSTLLDFEQIRTVTFKLIAKEVIGIGNDARLGNQSSEAIVTVTIKDTNDNSPDFDDQNTKFNVPEDSSVGYVIHTFIANDSDSGKFGHVIFSLADEDEKFNITSEGKLTLKSSLDREIRSSYFLVIIASDNPTAPESQQRKSQLQVTVRVTDVNDNDPEWNQPLTLFSVAETDRNGTLVTVLRATDGDVGFNAELEYSIDPNTNGSSYFNVRRNNDGQAELFITHDLKGLPGTFVVNITAKDKGAEPRNSTLQVQIKVVDVNLDPPVFVRPDMTIYNETNLPEIQVYEELTLGTVLYKLYAEDEGKGPNDHVSYYLVPSTSQDYTYFKVHPSTGNLTSTQRLDREKQELYVIQVKAEDSGLPTPLSTIISLRIRLLDTNDSDPIFPDNGPQRMSVFEETPNALIGIVMNATDDDEIDEICYYLCGYQPFLHLDKHRRRLSLTRSVDREHSTGFDVKVMASSDCGSSYFGNCSEAKTNSLLYIHVDVKDVDDNTPQFIRKVFSRIITFDTPVGTELINLKDKVLDPDAFPNNVYHFNLALLTPSPDMSKFYKGGGDPFFVSASGSIETNMLFQSDLVGYFQLKVEVYGNQSVKMNDTVDIKIDIVGISQRIRLVFSKVPDEVKTFIDDFIKELSQILHLDIHIGTIKTHINDDGSQDKTKTDTFIFARKNDSVAFMTAKELQKYIDQSKPAKILLFGNGIQEVKEAPSVECAPVKYFAADRNDYGPKFSAENFTAIVLENTPNGVPLTMASTIKVTDNDKGVNSQFRIFIEMMDGDPDTSFFTIPGQGQIIQASSSVTVVVNDSSLLDFEQIRTVTFKLIAVEVIGTGNDTKLGNQSSEAIVTVTIKETNDNSPVFDNQNTTFDVPEDSSIGDVIHTFVATDSDSGQFGQVTFSIGDEDKNSKFNISSDGKLTLKFSLDRETRSSYFLVIIASDNPTAPESQQRKSQLQVMVRVTDVNDKDPEWIYPLTFFSVAETDRVGTHVTVLRATDGDIGPNAELEYNVDLSTNGSSYFNVRRNEDGQAEIFTKRNLTGHPGTFVVNIIAEDKGDEPRESTLQIQIKVVDINLDPPVFVSPSMVSYDVTNGKLTEILVYEEVLIGTILYQLYAEDEGKGPNDNVSYYLVPSTSQDYTYFKVDPSNGYLMSAKRLDRERQEVYEIEVKAEDSGLPVSLFSTVTMRIRLLDVNDSDPVHIKSVMPQLVETIENKLNSSVFAVKNATNLIDDIIYNVCADTMTRLRPVAARGLDDLTILLMTQGLYGDRRSVALKCQYDNMEPHHTLACKLCMMWLALDWNIQVMGGRRHLPMTEGRSWNGMDCSVVQGRIQTESDGQGPVEVIVAVTYLAKSWV